jgi:hypothetical protein
MPKNGDALVGSHVNPCRCRLMQPHGQVEASKLVGTPVE